MEGYKTIAGLAESEFTEKRSRFISAAAPVSTPEEAADFLKIRREMHHEARHTVYAYVLKSGQQKYSDDGEPQGTGGMPVLEVIRKSGLSDVVVAVTRYFGGILLGAGGLTRAYTRGAADALAAAKVLEYAPCDILEVTCDYSQYGRIQNICPGLGARILASDLASAGTLRLLMRAEDADAFIAAVTELTAATAPIRVVERVFSVLE